MKKWIAIIIALVVLCSVFGGCSDAPDEVSGDVVYDIYSYHWENGTFYMQGTIRNLNREYDVLGLEDATLTVTDSKGLELFTVSVNRSVQQGLRLRPRSMAPYNITAQNLKYNEDDYSSLTSGLRVILNCTYFYSECDGRNCERCQYTGLDLNSNPFETSANSTNYPEKKDSDYNDPGHSDDAFTMECTRCKGSGKCEDCGGSGKSKLKGVLASGGCALCDASGRCYKCNGKGYTVHY